MAETVFFFGRLLESCEDSQTFLVYAWLHGTYSSSVDMNQVNVLHINQLFCWQSTRNMFPSLLMVLLILGIGEKNVLEAIDDQGEISQAVKKMFLSLANEVPNDSKQFSFYKLLHMSYLHIFSLMFFQPVFNWRDRLVL